MKLFFRLSAVYCVLFTILLFFCPEQLNDYLGNHIRVFSLICFFFAVIYLIVTIFRFMKAGFVIASWLAIAFIAGSVAFPDLSKFKFYNKKELDGMIKKEGINVALNNIKGIFLSKYLELKRQ